MNHQPLSSDQLPETPDETSAFRSSRVFTLLIIGGAVAVLFLVGWITTPEFVDIRNLRNIIRAAAIIGMIAVGMTFITIAGHFFSLSVVQTAALAGIAFAAMISWGWPVPLAVLAVLGVALMAGMAQGGLVAVGGNPIVVTLGFGAVVYGVTAIVSDNKTVRTGSDVAEWIGTSRPLGIPSQTWAFIIMAIIAAILLARTQMGRKVFFVGSNSDAAAAAGIRPSRVAIQVFAISAVTAAIAGIFTAALYGQGRLDLFDGNDIDAIAAILVGGAAIQGGEGSALRTALGAVFIAALKNLMVLRGFSYGVRIFYVGLAILISVSLFNYLRSRARVT